jgi:hypothetical protein
MVKMLKKIIGDDGLRGRKDGGEKRKREKKSARQRREIRHFLKLLSVPVSG